MKRALLLVAVVAALAGCGTTPQRHIPTRTVGGGYSTEVVTLNRRPLTCLVRTSANDFGTVFAISCDWVAYHQDGNGDPVGFRP